MGRQLSCGPSPGLGAGAMFTGGIRNLVGSSPAARGAAFLFAQGGCRLAREMACPRACWVRRTVLMRVLFPEGPSPVRGGFVRRACALVPHRLADPASAGCLFPCLHSLGLSGLRVLGIRSSRSIERVNPRTFGVFNFFGHLAVYRLGSSPFPGACSFSRCRYDSESGQSPY